MAAMVLGLSLCVYRGSTVRRIPNG
jgi:hypothetical protein